MKVLVWLSSVTPDDLYNQVGKEVWIQIMGAGTERPPLRLDIILCTRGEHRDTSE